MLVTEAFPSKYLSATDIPAENIKLVMSHVETTELEGKQKLVLFFHKAKKGLMLNKTNATNIATAYGNDTDDWSGKEIVLFEAMVDFQGKTVAAIRVRQPRAQDRAPPSRPPVEERHDERNPPPIGRSQALDDDIPF